MNRPEESEAEGRVLWHWVVALGVGAAVVGWGILQYHFIVDVARDWSYGSLPETPAASVYSTSTPANTKTVPQQMQPLPEAKPLTKQGGQK